MWQNRVGAGGEEDARRDVRPRVLIVRCCRMPTFVAAVELARVRCPDAEIVALTHTGFREVLERAGVDRVEELPGRRFGLLSLSVRVVARLRLERVDEVIIPQMTPFGEMHSNVYRVAAALNPRRLVIVPGAGEPQVVESAALLRFVLRHSIAAVLARFDTASFLLLLVAARLVPRRSGRGTARPRVLHIISSLGVGGAQVQLAELLNRTPSEAYDLELVVLGRDDGEFSRQWLTRSDIPVTYVERWPRLALSVMELAARCRAGRYDMVHTWLFMANMVGGAAARLAGVPLVIASVRNLSVWKREAVHRRWWHRIGDALGSRTADVITVNAQALVDDHARWAWISPRRMRVVHNGLDPAALAFDRRESRAALLQLTGAAPGSVLLGTVGRLAQEKDQATFLRVLASLRVRRPEIHGILIGEGEMRPALERLARDLDLGGHLTFLGRRADARRLAAGFDIFLLTSRSEGFPNVLLEAVLLDVPSVATHIAGAPDVLLSDASLFGVGDVDAGADRILALLEDPARAAHIAARARERALALFTCQRSVASWLELYREQLALRWGSVAPPGGDESVREQAA